MEPIDRLIWDPWNVRHVGRHGVTLQEVEEVCVGTFTHRQSYAGRILLVGSTNENRILAVVVEPQGNGVYYVVTARPASRRERRGYQEDMG